MEDVEEFLKLKIKEHRENNPGLNQFTQSTIYFYASRVRIIYTEFGKDIGILKYLRKFCRVVKDVQKKYPDIKTQRSSYNAIVTVLEALDEKQSTITKYNNKIKEIIIEVRKIDETVLKNENENENWMTMDEILERVSSLKESLNHKEGIELFDTYQRYLVLSLYTMIPPIRNNYVDVLVYSEKIPTEIDKNYIFLKEKQLVLNKYKTKSSYGVIVINLPDKLVDIIKEWMKIRETIVKEIKGRKELLFNVASPTPMLRRNLSKYLHKTIGKKVSVNMLRKIYLSQKYPVEFSSAEMKRDAEAMGHSIQTQQTIYRKK